MIEVYSVHVYAGLVDNTICCITIKSKLTVAFLMALSIYVFHIISSFLARLTGSYLPYPWRPSSASSSAASASAFG